MKPERLYICNLLFRLLPETRCFRLKASLIRWAGAKVGDNVRICSSATILGHGSLEIGDNTWIGQQVLIVCSSCVRIGKCVDVAPKVFIGTGTHQLDAAGEHSAGSGISRDVTIGDGVWLCVCSAVLPGLSIGTKSVVAAGAVVIRDVPEKIIVGGVPAQKLKDLESSEL